MASEISRNGQEERSRKRETGGGGGWAGTAASREKERPNGSGTTTALSWLAGHQPGQRNKLENTEINPVRIRNSVSYKDDMSDHCGRVSQLKKSRVWPIPRTLPQRHPKMEQRYNKHYKNETVKVLAKKWVHSCRNLSVWKAFLLPRNYTKKKKKRL